MYIMLLYMLYKCVFLSIIMNPIFSYCDKKLK